LFVVSAPSGAGKHTILREVLAADPQLAYSISATTRPPREGEADGREYYFLDRGEFMRRVDAGEFFEWARVHDRLYGTLRSEMDRRLALGTDVLLELDVQGMRNLKRQETDTDVVTVFILPPSLAVLEQRLRGRGTNTEEDIALRLRNARTEIEARGEYDYLVVNDRLDEAVADMKAIVRARRCRTAKCGGRWPLAS
jgi:guanylate kinase